MFPIVHVKAAMAMPATGRCMQLKGIEHNTKPTHLPTAITAPVQLVLLKIHYI